MKRTQEFVRAIFRGVQGDVSQAAKAANALLNPLVGSKKLSHATSKMSAYCSFYHMKFRYSLFVAAFEHMRVQLLRRDSKQTFRRINDGLMHSCKRRGQNLVHASP